MRSLLVFIFLFAGVPVLAGERLCLAEAIYFEGRDQSLRGQLAIGVVVRTRMASTRYPSTACEVTRQGHLGYPGRRRLYECQFSYFCDGRREQVVEGDDEAWRVAWNLAAFVLGTDISIDGFEGISHYHAATVRPNWASRLTYRGRIGGHLFYAP